MFGILGICLLTYLLLVPSANAQAAGPIVPPVTPPPMTGNPVYTQDPNLSDFTACVLPPSNPNYGTFVAGIVDQSCCCCVATDLANTSTTYTPTTSILTTPGSPRVRSVGVPLPPKQPNPNFRPIIVQFTKAVSKILVFPSLDHKFFGWDVYQYSVYGSNDLVNWQLLFDPTAVMGIDDPTGNTDPHFTLGTWSGTGPTLANNTLTLGKGFGGDIGYEAYFDFSTTGTYQFYGFIAGDITRTVGADKEAELGAVAEAVPCGVPGSGKGFIEVCKASSNTNPVTGDFTFQVTTSALSLIPFKIPVGACSGPIQVAAGPVKITETLIPPGVGVTAITASGFSPVTFLMENRLLTSPSLDLANGTATVIAVSGDISTETVAVFTNSKVPIGFVEVCKDALPGTTVTGSFSYSISGVPNVDVAVGACSPPIPVFVSPVTVAEVPKVGFQLVDVLTIPLANLVSKNLPGGSAVVTVGAGNTSVVRFINTPAAGQLKICKVGGDGVAGIFMFTVTARAQSYPVPAGPESQGGFCEVVDGTFPAHMPITVQETPIPSGVQVSTIAVNPPDRGTPVPGSDKVTVTIGTGITEVTFKNTLLNPCPLCTIILSNVTVGPGLCAPFPVTLATPAGAGGVFGTLTSSDPSKVVLPPANGASTTFFIQPGATASTRTAPYVCGVNFGSATITATASGLQSASQTVQVSATLSFSAASVTMTTTRQARLTLNLSAPAPVGGVTVNLSSDNPGVATVPATVTIPANNTSVNVPVTGVAVGATLIHASALPNVPDTTISVTVQ